MNKLNLFAVSLCAGFAFGCSPKVSTAKGVICDATMNTLAIVSEEGDTLSFSTLDAKRVVTDGILLDDTATVYYEGKYNAGMSAQKIVVVPGKKKMVATNTVVSVRPVTSGAKCNRIAFAYSRKASGWMRPTATSPPLSFSARTLPKWNCSSPPEIKMRSWTAAHFLPADMPGTWKTTTRRTYA